MVNPESAVAVASNAPVVLELFSCASGAGMGYHRAGFRVVAVDIEPQPRNPFPFFQGDAFHLLPQLLAQFHPAALHGSPPCQAYSPLNAYNKKVYPDLVDRTREAFAATGLPYVIENVPQAPLRNPTLLCGAMAEVGLRVYRHRSFETNWHLPQPTHLPHRERCTRNGYLPTPEAPFMSIHGGKHSKAWRERAALEMDVPWMGTIREVCEAIPPRYTEYIGGHLMAAVRGEPARAA
ncbi:DNA cytosine methyltransferase [Plantactinospora alkalitolerans]|nr:DNA cytosine methyltransferase [Plantactinospora alkalitolerans]